MSKENRSISTDVLTQLCHSHQFEENLYIPPSDANLINDSNTDPNCFRQKEKKLPPKYVENSTSVNGEESAKSSNFEPQWNKENKPIDTNLLTIPWHSQQTRNDCCIISPSEESLIDDSDADPSYVRQKKKKLRPKVYPNLSSSSLSDNSSSGTSNSSGSSRTITVSSSESETETRIVTDGVIQTLSQDVVNEDRNDQLNQEVKRGKKRLRRESTWKTNVCKVLRNSGKAYQSLSKTKKTVSERKVRTSYGENCRLRCNMNINEETRQIIFDAYWGLADLQRQREYIVRHTEEIKPKYIYSSTQDYRGLNRAFYFEVAGNKWE
ncbi:hypothetical protein EVAR_3868_1 [Eumeta japonica]|uniref:Uncharacterized protein n=1 Tax=Eumeta variegata TaxID=151549 RepID=A0A4C1SQQ7_EUMVA|nr:hypothetical protein EVAR_3868_1 [Eumeta japonica]